jgi:aryl-alcohol dehydrogenase-like predicted oxidoreductase
MKMTRGEFLRLFGRLAGASAAGTLLGRAGRTLAQAKPAPHPAADKPVLKRAIPSSGEMIPVIGSGTAVIYENEMAATDPKLTLLADSLRTLITNGGAMIDTSPTYGVAEKNLGEVMRRTGLRKQIFLATKISTTGEEAGIRQWEGSLRDLGTDRVDLLQVHNIRDTDTHLKTIRRLKNEGKTRYVGITTSFDRSYGDFEAIMKREKLDFIQIDYALDNRNAEERILPLARERGMAVIVNLPFGRGRLFGKAKGKELPPFAKDIDCTSWAQFFLKFLLSNPAVTVVIPGTDRPEFAIDNLNAARGRIPDAKMREMMVKYWDGLG